jgi:hypothetical protein
MPINIEDLAQNCQPLTLVDGSCIRFPGGAAICFNFPTIPADNGAAVRGLLAQANAALAPLAPIFTILDAVLAVADCVQGVPEAIIKLDPSKLIECIPNLVEKLAQLAQLVPQLSLVANLEIEIELLNNTNEPLLQLIGVVFGLLEVIGVQAPDLGDIESFTADTIEQSLAPIDALIDALTVVRQAIPA